MLPMEEGANIGPGKEASLRAMDLGKKENLISFRPRKGLPFPVCYSTRIPGSSELSMAMPLGQSQGGNADHSQGALILFLCC